MIKDLYVSYSAGSDSSTQIKSISDYYDKLARQIYDREAYRYYEVEDTSLRDALVHIDMAAFGRHYNSKEPLLSGSYLSYYLETVYTEYSAGKLKVRINFPYNKPDMDRHFEKMEKLSKELKGDTDYETVLNVHNYLIDHFDYDDSSSMKNHTDIDGFKDGVMVCSGYGLATYYLLNKAGVDTRIITGYGGEGDGPSNHLWNMVKLDGQWYNLDVTWDDLGGENKTYNYFLKSDKDFPKHIRVGGYDIDGGTPAVAKTSYKHPFTFNDIQNPEMIPRLLFGVFILGIVILICIKKIKAKRENRLIEPNSESSGKV
ncbi:MAG: hypothetical protein K6F55_01620 [Eubacterium sp.]|nr:hypothetical protein [Eubacterium sp.]